MTPGPQSVSAVSAGAGRFATSIARRSMCPVMSWTVNTAAPAIALTGREAAPNRARSGA